MLQRFSAGDPPASIYAAIERDGAAIVEQLFPDEQVDQWVADYRPHLDAVDWCNTQPGDQSAFFGLKTKRLHGLLGRSPGFEDALTQPLLLGMAEHFFEGRCRDFRLSTGELMVLGEAQEAQKLHRDADSWFFFPRPRPEILVSANVALTAFSEENGATVVVPGSHRWDPERKAGPEECCQAVMPKGSALLYSGNVLHGGGANRTAAVRIGMYFGYLYSWLAPLEDTRAHLDEAVLRAASPRVQRLLGYSETGWQVIP